MAHPRKKTRHTRRCQMREKAKGCIDRTASVGSRRQSIKGYICRQGIADLSMMGWVEMHFDERIWDSGQPLEHSLIEPACVKKPPTLNKLDHFWAVSLNGSSRTTIWYSAVELSPDSKTL